MTVRALKPAPQKNNFSTQFAYYVEKMKMMYVKEIPVGWKPWSRGYGMRHMF